MLTACKQSLGKVIFSEACVIMSTESPGEGLCPGVSLSKGEGLCPRGVSVQGCLCP